MRRNRPLETGCIFQNYIRNFIPNREFLNLIHIKIWFEKVVAPAGLEPGEATLKRCSFLILSAGTFHHACGSEWIDNLFLKWWPRPDLNRHAHTDNRF